MNKVFESTIVNMFSHTPEIHLLKKKSLAARELKTLINNEFILNLNFSYLSNGVESWWKKIEQNTSFHVLKFHFIQWLLNNIKKSDACYFDKVGFNGIAGVCITNIFKVIFFSLVLMKYQHLLYVLYIY